MVEAEQAAHSAGRTRRKTKWSFLHTWGAVEECDNLSRLLKLITNSMKGTNMRNVMHSLGEEDHERSETGQSCRKLKSPCHHCRICKVHGGASNSIAQFGLPTYGRRRSFNVSKRILWCTKAFCQNDGNPREPSRLPLVEEDLVAICQALRQALYEGIEVNCKRCQSASVPRKQ